MKTRLGYFLILVCMLLVAACKNTPSSAAGEVAAVDEGAGGCEGEKAKAILWIDYKKEKMPLPDGTVVKTVKVYAQVFADGSLKILSFCKKQPVKVGNYLLKRVEMYRIRKEAMEEKYLEPGEQYLQLRYVPGWMK